MRDDIDILLFLMYCVLWFVLGIVLLIAGNVLVTIPSTPASVFAVVGAVGLGCYWVRRRSAQRASKRDACFAHLDTELCKWLSVATRELGEQSRRRIAEDISTHYQDALSEALATGRTDANQWALRSLGNAKAARYAFRRVYPSAHEESWVRRVRNDELGSFQRMLPGVIAVHGTLLLALEIGFEWWYSGKELSPGAVLTGIIFVGIAIDETMRRDRIRCRQDEALR